MVMPFSPDPLDYDFCMVPSQGRHPHSEDREPVGWESESTWAGVCCRPRGCPEGTLPQHTPTLRGRLVMPLHSQAPSESQSLPKANVLVLCHRATLLGTQGPPKCRREREPIAPTLGRIPTDTTTSQQPLPAPG